MKTETCDLYRHYDKEWNLLYVGISLNSIKRMIDHRSQSKEWFDEIAFTQRKTFPSRAEAEKAEAIAIRNENPKWNKDRPLGTASQNLNEFTHEDFMNGLLEQADFVREKNGLPPLYTKDQEEADLVNRLRNKVIEQGNSISLLLSEIKSLEAKFKQYEDRQEEILEIDGSNWKFLKDTLGFEHRSSKKENGYIVPIWARTKGGMLDSCVKLAEKIWDLRQEFETHMGHKEFGKKDSDSIPMFMRIQNQGAVEEAMMTHLSKLTEHLGLEWDGRDQSLKKKKLPKGGKRAIEKQAA